MFTFTVDMIFYTRFGQVIGACGIQAEIADQPKVENSKSCFSPVLVGPGSQVGLKVGVETCICFLKMRRKITQVGAVEA